MLKIRLFYLKRVSIEDSLLSDKATNKTIAKLSLGLKALKKESLVLNKEYQVLQKGFLFDAEIDLENFNRNKRLNALYDRIFKKR